MMRPPGQLGAWITHTSHPSAATGSAQWDASRRFEFGIRIQQAVDGEHQGDKIVAQATQVFGRTLAQQLQLLEQLVTVHVAQPSQSALDAASLAPRSGAP